MIVFASDSVASMRDWAAAPKSTAVGAAKVQRATPPVARSGPLWPPMAMAAPLQRQCTTCDAVSGQPPQLEGDRASRTLALVNQAISSSGQPLDGGTRTRFASRTGHHLGDVRVHNDGVAAASARALAARAYTIGRDIVFGAGELAPGTPQGQRLLGHELTHVIQQRNARSLVASSATPLTISASADRAEGEADRVADALDDRGAPPSIVERPVALLSRAPFDVDAIAKDSDALADAPISILPDVRVSELFLKTGGHISGELTKAADYPRTFTPPATLSTPVSTAALPKADAVPRLSPDIPVDAHFFPSLQPTSRRALVLGGFHGDEQPGWQVTDALVNELSRTGARGRLDFHTIVVPRVNAAAIKDELAGTRLWRNRCNRQLVDLNRNFPTGETPKDTDCPNTVGAPIQPEVQGVMDVVTKFKPARIVSTHAIRDPKSTGIFADPNKNPQAIELARGMASTVVNESDRPANRLGPGVRQFNPVYPGDKPGVVSAGTSLGAWAPTAVTDKPVPVPVITMEAPTFGPLGGGKGDSPRTVEGYLRPVRAFLGDPASLATAADRDILADIDAFTVANQLAFLTGRLPLADDIFRRIRLRVDTAVAKLNAMSPPKQLVPKSQLRLFSVGSSSQSKIDFDKFFLAGEMTTKGWDTLPDSWFIDGNRKKGVARDRWLAAPSIDRLREILRFSALPGASRHHWGTEVDFNSVEVADWRQGPPGKPDGQFFALGQWLKVNAPRVADVGLVQAYTPGRSGGYQEEPWHYSYAPISLGLRERYNIKVNLTTDVAVQIEDEFRKRASAAGEKVPSDFAEALRKINISDLVNNVGPGL